MTAKEYRNALVRSLADIDQLLTEGNRIAAEDTIEGDYAEYIVTEFEEKRRAVEAKLRDDVWTIKELIEKAAG